MASYLRPTRLENALAALADRPRTLLAGGTDHYPARATFEPEEDILDLTAIPELNGIALQNGHWRIGALTTWTTIAEAPLPPIFNALKQAALQVGGRQIQNAGTLIGNVCNASPAADGIPPLLALDAEIELRSPTATRTLPLASFVLGPRRTARRADEIATALLIPDAPGNSHFHKLGARRYLVISIAMVAITLAQDPAGRITRAAIAVGACSPVATRLPALETALLGHPPDPALLRPEHLAPLSPIDDMRAPASYRTEAVLELLRRSLEAFTPQASTHQALAA